MGGGGAVRAAAKLSGIGVFNGGIPRVPVMPPAEYSVRNATRPVSTMPRVVFGRVPSFQEAKEATVDLQDALDKVYLSSPKSPVFGDTFAADHDSVLSSLTNPELDSKSCVFFEATPTPVRNNVLQALKLFSESTKVQTVVASIVSDPNVWNAMMDNTMLKDYLASEQRNDVPEPQSPKRFEETSAGGVDGVPEPDGGPTGSKENNTGMMQNIMLTVLEMVSNVSNFFQNIFGVSASDDIPSDSNGNTKTAGSDDIPFDSSGNTKTAGATIMAFVVMVIMVIVFKRV